jgi:hypothetical protein
MVQHLPAATDTVQLVKKLLVTLETEGSSQSTHKLAIEQYLKPAHMSKPISLT